jgi:hypothetical protein
LDNGQLPATRHISRFIVPPWTTRQCSTSVTKAAPPASRPSLRPWRQSPARVSFPPIDSHARPFFPADTFPPQDSCYNRRRCGMTATYTAGTSHRPQSTSRQPPCLHPTSVVSPATRFSEDPLIVEAATIEVVRAAEANDQTTEQADTAVEAGGSARR